MSTYDKVKEVVVDLLRDEDSLTHEDLVKGLQDNLDESWYTSGPRFAVLRLSSEGIIDDSIGGSIEKGPKFPECDQDPDSIIEEALERGEKYKRDIFKNRCLTTGGFLDRIDRRRSDFEHDVIGGEYFYLVDDHGDRHWPLWQLEGSRTPDGFAFINAYLFHTREMDQWSVYLFWACQDNHGKLPIDQLKAGKLNRLFSHARSVWKHGAK